jgi:hypothetical protein
MEQAYGHFQGGCCGVPPKLHNSTQGPVPIPVMFPYLLVTDTFPHLPPFLLYRGHYNSFGGHAYFGILWEVAPHI